MHLSHVYIMTNKNNTVLYIGVTSFLIKRVYQHKTKFHKGFTAKYNCDKLVFFTEFENIVDAIALEKKLKAGSREKKEKLINTMNPDWKDLSEDWLFDFK